MHGHVLGSFSSAKTFFVSSVFVLYATIEACKTTALKFCFRSLEKESLASIMKQTH